MNEYDFLPSSPTGFVYQMTAGLLADGKVHTRSEIIEHVLKCGKELGISISEGHLSGINHFLRTSSSIRLSRGKYQIKIEGNELPPQSRIDRAATILETAVERFSILSHEINILQATEDDAKEIDLYRSAVSALCKSREEVLKFKEQRLASTLEKTQEMGGMELG